MFILQSSDRKTMARWGAGHDFNVLLAELHSAMCRPAHACPIDEGGSSDGPEGAPRGILLAARRSPRRKREH